MKRPIYAVCISIFIICAAPFAGTLTLPEAQKLLVKNNADIQIAEARYLKSLVEVSEAKSAYYPTAETFASYMYQSKPNRIDIETEITGIVPKFGQALNLTLEDQPIALDLSEPVGDYDRFEWGLDLKYPLFTGFARKNAVLAKKTTSNIHNLSLSIAKDRLSLKLGLLYFMWELSIKRLAVQKAYIEQVSEHVVQIQNLFAAGVESRSKVLQASARLEAAKVELLSAQSAADSLRFELIDFIKCEDALATPKAYDYELPDHIIHSRPRPYRPEIASIDSTIKSLQLYEKSIRGQRFPALFLMAGYRVGNPGIIMGGDEFIDWGVGGMQVQWTIYDGQKNWAQREALRHDMIILKKQRKKQLDTWDKTASQQRLQITKARRMKAAADLSLQAAEAAEEDLSNALASGVVSSQDHLNAIAAVAQAQFRVAQAETMLKIASLRLAYALGERMEFR